MIRAKEKSASRPKARKAKRVPRGVRVSVPVEQFKSVVLAVSPNTSDTHCQKCGKRLIPMTPAEKQRAYRERLRAKA
mgnify:CR=1 FL=1